MSKDKIMTFRQLESKVNKLESITVLNSILIAMMAVLLLVL
jgi:hypothetical protein